ncbi:sensor histidine kinase [Schlesneria sp. DSM 10557]|uniref:HAMP domain-containing sensor histidine kinase n=2 Tax=unclassified Schlesneria TaxID=2762017 RepID=UPI00359FE1C3
MKLTFKLVFALIAFIVVILGIDAYLSVQRESKFLRAELERKAYRIGSAMKELVADAWRREGPEVALALIQAANERERLLLIRWVWLDGRSGERFRPHASTERLGKVSLREPVTLQYRTADGNEYLVTYVSVNVDQRPGALELTEPLSMTDHFVRTSLYRKIALTAIVVAGSIGVTLLLGIWLVGWPLKRLIDKARRVGAGDLTEPIELRSRDELSELADTLNQMCESLLESEQRIRQEADARIATIEQLRHADRLRTVGQLASGVAHELGTPLNVVTGRASLITSGRLAPDAIVESAQIIKAQAERMATIIRHLLDFSRSGKSHRTNVDLQMIMRETSQILNQLSHKHEVDLVVRTSPEPMIACVDPGQIQQVLTNLVVNAIQASDPGGRVAISVTEDRRSPPASDAVPADYFCICVDDNGHGIPPEIRGRVFEPFVTTKDVGEGTGLGLSIAYGIVREHGGWIDVQSEVGRGSQFRVYLPKDHVKCPAE